MPALVLVHIILYCIFFFSTAVNVFILISAYFLVSSQIKAKKLLKLWAQVVFYCIVTYLISSCFIAKDFSIKTLISCFFPVITGKYWFFTAYFVLMLLSPFLNKILNNATKKELYCLSIILFILAYLSTKHPIGGVFNLSAGFSVLWFICLYIFAGTLKLYPINIKKRYLLIIYFVATALLWIFSMNPANNYWYNLVYNSLDYTSPLVIIASVALLLLFKNVNIKNLYMHNIICYVATLTFGIYIIEGSFLHNYFHWNIFRIQNYYASPISPIWVLLVALGKFVFCAIIEALRQLFVILLKKIKDKYVERKNIINQKNNDATANN